MPSNELSSVCPKCGSNREPPWDYPSGWSCGSIAESSFTGQLRDAEQQVEKARNEREDAFEQLAAAQDKLAEAEAILKAVEWGCGEPDESFGRCPECDMPDFKGHTTGCQLGNYLHPKASVNSTPGAKQ